MKTHHLLPLLLVVLAFSCKKKDDVVEATPQDPATMVLPSAIRAGQDTGLGIIYMDYDPDLVVNTGPSHLKDSIALDLDADGEADFMTTHQISDPYMLGARWSKLEIRPLGDNQVCVNAATPDLVDSLSFHTLIDSSRTWSNETCILFEYHWSMAGSESTYGYFRNNGPYYVGFKINKNNAAYYGWLYFRGTWIDKYGITAAYEE